MFRLTPLSKRPASGAENASLNTEGETGEAGRTPATDAYIAPEMKSWFPIYRAGSKLIVPTRVGNTPSRLFILETGSPFGFVAPDVAREVTRVSDAGAFYVSGITGKGTPIGQTGEVNIVFAGVQQKLSSMGAFDVLSLSADVGMQVSGIIGMTTLQQVVLSIDYRDNLLHVVYDPKHGFH